MNSYLIGIISLLIFFFVFLLLEKIIPSRADKELTRKAAHILAGLFAISMAFILDGHVFIIFTGISIITMIFAYRIRLFSFIHNVDRLTLGEILFPVGVLAAYVTVGATTIFYVSILILTFADSVGSLVFCYYKKYPYLGSTAFFFVTIFIFFIFYGFQLNLLLIALVITVIERVSPYGSDNLSIPVSSAFLLKLFF